MANKPVECNLAAFVVISHFEGSGIKEVVGQGTSWGMVDSLLMLVHYSVTLFFGSSVVVQAQWAVWFVEHDVNGPRLD